MPRHRAVSTRATRHRRTDPRSRIVAAALTTFANRGVGASAIQDVADAAGMSKQALLHHFRKKELLRAGVYELLAQRLRDALPEAAADLVSRSHDRYRRLIELALQQFIDHREVARFMTYELLERPEAVLAWLRDEAALWLSMVRGVVEQSDKKAHALDAEAHVGVLVTLMLAQSALTPRRDPRWLARTRAATLEVLLLANRLK